MASSININIDFIWCAFSWPPKIELTECLGMTLVIVSMSYQVSGTKVVYLRMGLRRMFKAQLYVSLPFSRPEILRKPFVSNCLSQCWYFIWHSANSHFGDEIKADQIKPGVKMWQNYATARYWYQIWCELSWGLTFQSQKISAFHHLYKWHKLWGKNGVNTVKPHSCESEGTD